MSNVSAPTVYIWAADSPNTSPDRLPATTCPACTVLVAVADLDSHLTWHRTVIGDVPAGGAR